MSTGEAGAGDVHGPELLILDEPTNGHPSLPRDSA